MGPTENFRRALEYSILAFATYMLSIVAAFSWNGAAQESLSKYKNTWKHWIYAVFITIFAVIIITIIAVTYVDNDGVAKIRRPL